jgi:dTDP-4-amino-4,6-dideoxygalactose transaminase
MPKRRPADLAIFGGDPEFEEALHVGRPNIGNRQRFLDRINDMLDRRWLTNHGPYVDELEQRLAKLIEAKHCIAVCNATIGLELATQAVGMAGEVIVPSFTFIATAHALQWQGITPVFCDIDPATHNIDPRRAEELITPRTTGIVGVHVWGRPCNIEALTEIAQRHDLRMVFDAAHALGCSYRGKMIGNFGDAEVFSFHATKFFNTFEGGAITTNDDELAEKLRLMKNFGFAGRDTVVYIGTNGKMSEASAAMGLTGLESLDEFIRVNYRNYSVYQQVFKDMPGFRMISYDETERRNYQYIIVEVNEAVAGTNRDQIVEVLNAENVLARRYFYPGCHKMEPYRSYFPHAGLLLPETEFLTQRVMSLPTGNAMEPEYIRRIGHLIRFAVDHSEEIDARLAEG